MKIKTDFVTNSSSVSFLFIWKGDKVDLIKAMINNKKKFKIKYKGIKVDVWDVIRSLDKHMRVSDDDFWMLPEVRTLDETILDYADEQRNWERITNESHDCSDDVGFYLETVKILEDSKDIKKLTSTFDIEFGIDFGLVRGTPITEAIAMMFEQLTFQEDDLVVLTRDRGIK